MIDILNNFKICLLDVFLFVPFIFAGLFGALVFIKNPIYIRRLAKTFFTIHFVFASLIVLCIDKTEFSLFGYKFLYDKISAVFIFITALLFLLFSILSKTFIKKLHRMFYSTLILFLAVINLLLFLDNVFISLVCIFWFYLILYFLFESFSKKEGRKYNKTRLVSEIFWYLCSLFLICWDFIRYFVVNNIEFNYSNIMQNLYHINDLSISLAFMGFLILIFQFFGFLPFGFKLFNNTDEQNNLINCIASISSIITGAFLFIKVYSFLDYLLYENEKIITLYLLINLIYFTINLFEESNVIRYIQNVLKLSIPFGIFLLFAFCNAGLASYLFYFTALIFSVSLLYFIFIILADKFKTNSFFEFKKITDKNKLIQFFTIFALLNFVKTPFLAMFSSSLYGILIIFCIEFDNSFMAYIPHLTVIFGLILSLSLLSVSYKILIEPCEKSNTATRLANHQIAPLAILTFAIILMGLFPEYIFNHFIENLYIGHF